MSLTIMEAIDNLKKSGGGGNEFVINMYYDEAEQKTRLNKTFAEILDAIRNGLNPVVFGDDHTDDPETYFSRYKYTWNTAYYSATDELTNCYIVFVNHEFEIYDGEPEGAVHFRILYGDDSLKSGNVEFDGIHIDS